MAREAKLEAAGAGVAPTGPGWFVVNARDAQWQAGHFGAFTRFEGQGAEFPSLGINIGVIEPGQPSCFYHGEDEQEDFLVLSGQCVLIIEDQERHLKAWDFVHCPAWTEHVFVGAGDGPCALLAVGSRLNDGVVYPASEVAQSYGAGVASETRDPEQAYAGIVDDTDTPFQDEWLPGAAPSSRNPGT